MLALLKVKTSVPVLVNPPVPVITPLAIFTATVLLFTVNTLPFKLIEVNVKVLEGEDVVVIKVPIVAALSNVIVPVNELLPVES